MQVDAHQHRTMITSLRQEAGRGPWLRLLSEVLTLAGPDCELVRHSERTWASATFSGARHTIALAFNGLDTFDAAENFIARLPEHEFAIPRQIVADATITAVDQQAIPEAKIHVEAELLLLDDT